MALYSAFSFSQLSCLVITSLCIFSLLYRPSFLLTITTSHHTSSLFAMILLLFPIHLRTPRLSFPAHSDLPTCPLASRKLRFFLFLSYSSSAFLLAFCVQLFQPPPRFALSFSRGKITFISELFPFPGSLTSVLMVPEFVCVFVQLSAQRYHPNLGKLASLAKILK